MNQAPVPGAGVSLPALQAAYVGLVALWHLSPGEQASVLALKAPPRGLEGWRPHVGHLRHEHRERIVRLLEVQAALLALFPDDVHAAGSWLRQERTDMPFGGRPPLALLMTGRLGELIVVQAYLTGLAAAYRPETRPDGVPHAAGGAVPGPDWEDAHIPVCA